MMMKKTTSALAVAALLGTGAASAATFQVNDDSSLTVGGDIIFAYDTNTLATGATETTFTDFGSSLVFAGEQTLDNGLTTSFYLDFDEFGNLGDGAGDFATDEYHVSFAGDFGEIKIGNEGSVTGSVTDITAGENDSTILAEETSTEVVQYHSNEFNGFSFAVQAQPLGDGNQADGTLSLAGYVQADLGAFTLGAAYDQRENATNDGDVTGFVASTTLAGVGVTATYVQDEETNDKKDITALALSYGIGGVSLYGQYQSVTFDTEAAADNAGTGNQDGTSFNQYFVGANYSVLPNTYVWAEIGEHDLTNEESDYFSTGLNYSW